jgi:16S rRNA (cytosine1402-N4)-methyltransferase
MPEAYHIPVLGAQVLSTLLVELHGTYLDGTLGGGGHAQLFLNKLKKDAVYIGMDRDSEAIAYCRQRLSRFKNIVYHQGTFDEFETALRIAGVRVLDGLFLDLGVSGHQIDDGNRGFAYRPGLILDMRMNQNDSQTVRDILNGYDESELIRVFKQYGEERYARNIARRIVKERQNHVLTRSDDLLDIINRSVPGKTVIKSYARIFQALRIELNNELNLLQKTLIRSVPYLKPGGRVGIISYHSGEDRIVKSFFREQENPCTCPPDIPYCSCGKKPVMRRLKPHLIVPDDEEVRQNPRSRSAKYRVGEKI